MVHTTPTSESSISYWVLETASKAGDVEYFCIADGAWHTVEQIENGIHFCREGDAKAALRLLQDSFMYYPAAAQATAVEYTKTFYGR